MRGLSFVTLLSYDYRYAFDAIQTYYPIADEIILGLDRDRLTWTRKPFHIDMNELRSFIAKKDAFRKIRVIEDNFHASDIPIENDTAERNALGQRCIRGNWIVQIDSDELLINAADFRKWLLTIPPDMGALGRWITVFKTFGNQALIISPSKELTPLATQLRDGYTACRRTAQKYLESPLKMLHLSWGRSPQDLRTKLENWSHAHDFDVAKYLAFWEGITLENYQQYKDFHPVHRDYWEKLTPITLQGIETTHAWNKSR